MPSEEEEENKMEGEEEAAPAIQVSPPRLSPPCLNRRWMRIYCCSTKATTYPLPCGPYLRA